MAQAGLNANRRDAEARRLSGTTGLSADCLRCFSLGLCGEIFLLLPRKILL
jgi:hypothetical protein